MEQERTPFSIHSEQNDSVIKPESKEDASPTILSKLRKKTGKIAKGLAIVGMLSTAEITDQQNPHHPTTYEQFHEQKLKKNRFLDEQSYTKLAELNPHDALEVADSYQYKPWAWKIIENTIDSLKYEALQYADKYKDIPNSKEIIKRTVTKGVEEGHVYFVLEYANSFADEPYAKEIIEKIADTNPGVVIEFANHFVTQPYAQKIVEKIATPDCSEIIKSVIIRQAKNFKDVQWGKKIIEEIAESQPRDVLLYAEELMSLPYATELIERSIKKSPSSMIRNEYTEFSDMYANGATLKILQESNDPFIQTLSKIKKIKYDDYIKENMCAMIDEIINNGLTLENAAYIAGDEKQFLEELIKIKLRPNHFGDEIVDYFLTRKSLEKVEKINRLHEETDAMRFKSIENSSPQDLYLLLVYGDEEIFTSSFNGIFNRLIERAKQTNITGIQLLEEIGYVKFRTFIRSCTEFNRFGDFLNTMTKDQQEEVLQRFIKNLDKTKDSLREAISIAEAIETTNNPEILKILAEEIKKQINNTRIDRKEIKILYKLIATTLTSKEPGDAWLKEIQKEYQIPSLIEVPSKELFNANGKNVQKYFFYDDEDGRVTFKNFLDQYKNNGEWKIKDAGTYVVISARSNNREIVIYANKPEKEYVGQEQIAKELEKQNIQTLVAVHRGHSYHAQKTIEKIPPSAKIVSLGSCGGYRNLSDVFKHAPQAHVISTKGTGTKFVNEPLLKILNEEILSGRDINWSDFWKKAERKIGNDKFKNYVAPNKNFGLAFIKTYKQALDKEILHQ
ncbi:MAG: hypothetical protein AB1333_00990 [Patescibacteria group bacterium]